jgi:hypothetical protein
MAKYTSFMSEDPALVPDSRVEEIRSIYGEQDAYGNSIANLRANLKLTPVERIRKAERFAAFAAKYKGVIHRQNEV